jgi:hypothetical protein
MLSPTETSTVCHHLVRRRLVAWEVEELQSAAHLHEEIPMTTVSVTPAPELQPLSEPARILNTFISPRKTFTDIRRSAAWWGPFLITVILAIAFGCALDAKVGYRKVVDNQIERSPKVAQQFEQLSREDRDRQLNGRAKFTKYFLYGFPVVGVIWNLIVAA